MKNIGDLFLLMVIAFVFGEKKTHSKGNMRLTWIAHVFKMSFETAIDVLTATSSIPSPGRG